MILSVRPVLDEAMRQLCRRPYPGPGHRNGCPNYGRKAGCPPAAPLFGDVYDLGQPVFAIVTEFDLAAHVARMRVGHPGWSDAQCRCLRWWQPHARKVLSDEIEMFFRQYAGYRVEANPEAMAVNVTATLAGVGILLEWPPVKWARQVALAAVRRGEGGVLT